MTSAEYEEALSAADGLFRLIETDFRSEFGNDHLARLSAAVAKYHAARSSIEDSAPNELAATIDAADELADWSDDLVEVQAEPSNEQWKSLLGVFGAWQHYGKVRFGTEPRL